MSTASAPGKIILFGEHAVVYNRPAIAIPVAQVKATVKVESRTGPVQIDAPDISRRYALEDAGPEDPIATMVRQTCARLGAPPKDFTVRIESTIPVARGLGSGAAVSVALGRALASFLGRDLTPQEICDLAFEIEKLHHGTPSGIDNTVIAFERPVYFVKGQTSESFRVAQPLTFAIADTGVASPTKDVVGDVRRALDSDRSRFEALFDRVGALARAARTAIEFGDIDALGPLMIENQRLARSMGISSIEIDNLTHAAMRAGARGAKLSGAGRGGNVIALVDARTHGKVERALMDAGAVRVIVTRLE